MSRIQILGTLLDASFDGTDLSDKNFDCYHILKSLMPKQNQTTIDIPKTSGLYQSSKKFESNQLTLRGLVDCTSYSDLMTKLQTLSAFLYSDSDKELIPSNADDRYYNVQYLDYVIIEERDDYALVDLIFNCNDPFAYDNTPSTDSQTITVIDTTYTVANGGHYYAFPEITITFNQAQTHVYISNSSITDNRFDISKVFLTNDVLIIDCKNRTITLNGSYSPAGVGDGGNSLAEWIKLATGDNDVVVGTNDATIDVDVDISFDKVYLY